MNTGVGAAFITPAVPDLPRVDKLTHRATDLRVRIIDRNLLGKTGVMNAALPRLVCMLTAKNDAHPVVTPLVGPYE